MLSGLGSAFHSTAIANAGNHLTSNLSIAWLSVILMLIVGALSLFSVKIVARIIFWLIVLQVVAFVALIGMLAFHSHTDFVTALGNYSNHPGAYTRSSRARSRTGCLRHLHRGRGGDHPVHGAQLQRRAVLLLRRRRAAPAGPHLPDRLGGQHRRARGALGRRLGGPARAGRPDLHAGPGEPGRDQPDRLRKITSLSSVAGGLGYGMVLSPDPITKILFATAVPFAEIAVNLAFLTVTTRVLFAQAFDRLLR
jgi:Gamma-aminobutyrate permease and related permeases